MHLHLALKPDIDTSVNSLKCCSTEIKTWLLQNFYTMGIKLKSCFLKPLIVRPLNITLFLR